ncbi:helix-turn-helix domain-containing protein [Nocardia sp. MW-W600-9]
MEFFPGIGAPTDRDRVGAIVADEQLNLVLGLRAIRQRRGMSLADVADRMGVDQSAVSRFESGGTNPTMSTIRRYAKAVMGVFRVQTYPWEEVSYRANASVSGELLAPIADMDPSWVGPSSADFRVTYR